MIYVKLQKWYRKYQLQEIQLQGKRSDKNSLQDTRSDFLNCVDFFLKMTTFLLAPFFMESFKCHYTVYINLAMSMPLQTLRHICCNIYAFFAYNKTSYTCINYPFAFRPIYYVTFRFVISILIKCGHSWKKNHIPSIMSIVAKVNASLIQKYAIELYNLVLPFFSSINGFLATLLNEISN